MIKTIKKRIAVLFAACTLALCGGFAYVPPVAAFAEDAVASTESVPTNETLDENAGNEEISNDNEIIDQTPTDEETGENGAILGEYTEEEIKGFIQEAYQKAKDWIKNTYAWIIGIVGGGGVALLLSVFWKLIGEKIRKTNNLTEEKIEEICERTAKKVVAKIVGKSLNVDIRSEVSAAVKAELAPMIRNAQVAMESAKNAEVGTAMVLKAQAKSRLISEDETEEMENRAASLLAHAEKYGGLSVPIQINPALNEEPKEREKVNLVEEVAKPKEKKENECFMSFD
jgi:hypothetical protein